MRSPRHRPRTRAVEGDVAAPAWRVWIQVLDETVAEHHRQLRLAESPAAERCNRLFGDVAPSCAVAEEGAHEIRRDELHVLPRRDGADGIRRRARRDEGDPI